MLKLNFFYDIILNSDVFMKREDVDRNQLSPMMKQYMEVKDNYKEELLFFRLGDFYELFFEDGITASHELELTLTGKNAGLDERIPMCGVPHHSVSPYIEKLVNLGYKVAIAEQLEDPKDVKGVVKRDVVQVVSKGTIVDLELLKSYDNNYIASLLDFEYVYVLTYADISTGVVNSLMLPHMKDKVLNEILALGIKEIILENSDDVEIINTLKNMHGVGVTISDGILEDKYQSIYKNLEDPKQVQGVKHLLYYLVVKELKDLSHIETVEVVNRAEYLEMDVHTLRNLELVETVRQKERTNSLIWLLDKTKTAMGSRTLKNYLLNPLKDIKRINERYDMIEVFNTDFITRDMLRNDLFEVYDLERLCAKLIAGNINARDLLQIKTSLKVLPDIKGKIKTLGFKYKLNTHDNLYNLLENAIYETPPVTIREGFIIKDGYNSELDELKSIRSGGKDFIAKLEASEREKTGIKTLKVGYNKVFGYYIEISKGQAKEVKEEFGYERRQTLTNAERFISPELKEKEALILNAEEKIIELEYQLFNEVKDELKKYIFELKDSARVISELDAICSLAVVADEYQFVRPSLIEERNLEIIDGRHPVVEKVNKISYVPNDCIMNDKTCTLLITGPNMSGKSTYMRQVAITIIMAQMGSFVPAKKCTMPIFDKIFTRIGASDDLVSGESTFMVEMLEARNAIVNATEDSLILFDELGRGTATYDGMSLAEAILEYVNTNIKCKTLFSTHYHEITVMEKRFPGIKNVHVAATEEDGNIIFLHKVKNGAVDKSYGIHVAKLAKMPESVIKRANEILKYYEGNSEVKKQTAPHEQVVFDFEEEAKTSPVDDKLKTIDPLKMTPMDAINLLYELKELSKK